jgi:DNA replication protein DnaC
MTPLESFKSVPSSYVLSGIPAVHAESHLANFENRYEREKNGPAFWKSLLQTANTLLTNQDKFQKFCFLCGLPGCGKTHFLVGLYRALVNQMGYSQGDGAVFCTFASLGQEIIAGFKDNIPIRTAMTGFTQAKFLFIDDFTADERILKAGSMEQTVLRDLILDRYDKGFYLLTTSNFSSVDLLSELDKIFGPHITSRLAGSRVLQFPAIDLRRNK